MSPEISLEIERTTEQIVEKLLIRNQTLSLAESCTGGLVSAQVSRLAGVSRVYTGGIIAYSNQIKSDFLNVPVATLERHGAVSSQTALAMAQGACLRLRTDWAVSVTGIAGPGGGSPEKPVGTVHFAVVGTKFDGSKIAESERQLFLGSRVEVQEQAAKFALDLLLKKLALWGSPGAL